MPFVPNIICARAAFVNTKQHKSLQVNSSIGQTYAVAGYLSRKPSRIKLSQACEALALPVGSHEQGYNLWVSPSPFKESAGCGKAAQAEPNTKGVEDLSKTSISLTRKRYG